MTIGEKIKKYRQKLDISQKLLAIRCKMSEPAIRNYELGNRTPSPKHLQTISEALGVSQYAISEPNLDTYEGILHALFYLEEYYGLVASKDDCYNTFRFDIKDPNGRILDNMISEWIKKKEALAQGQITQEYYSEWLSSYPRLFTTECEQRIREKRNNS